MKTFVLVAALLAHAAAGQGNSANAPGNQKSGSPGNSGNAPGHNKVSGSPGNSGNAPGQNKLSGSPGNSGNAPGQNKVPPGQQKKLPGSPGSPSTFGVTAGQPGVGAPAPGAPGAPAPAPPANASCFPGEAFVGSSVAATYSSPLGFLHKLEGDASFYAIQHEAGELRATGNHLLFNGEGVAQAAERFLPGDELLLAGGEHSRVLSSRKDSTTFGMFAPLTASGSIEVDGATVSAYATVSQLDIPHSAMHASFLLSRVFSSMQAEDSASMETVNPLAHVFRSVLKLDKLL